MTTGGVEDEMEKGLAMNIIECGGVGGKGVKVQSRGRRGVARKHGAPKELWRLEKHGTKRLTL